MLNIVDMERSGIPTLTVPGLSDRTEGGCARCAAYQPDPQLDGSLVVDPEIHLPSPGMDVDIAYFYNSLSSYNGPYGYGRTISVNLLAQAWGGSPSFPAGSIVTMTRGNGALVSYQSDVHNNFLPKTPGVLNTLGKGAVSPFWMETTLDGQVTYYPVQGPGATVSAQRIEDAVGNQHTFLYSGGLLQTLQDSVGRLVTFGYASGLLQTVQDWAGRVTTFAYDSNSVPGKPLLTTVTGPTGCQTVYKYNGTPLLVGVIDPNGYGTSYSYDGSNRVSTRTVQAAPSGPAVTTFSYPSGTQTVWQDPTGAVTTYTRDTNGQLTGVQNPLGAITTFTRNSNEQETSRQDPLGNITTTNYDSNGNVIGIINALGYRATLQYDAFNNATTLTYADGLIVTQVWGYAGSPFDTTGTKRRLQAVVNQLGYRTSYVYTGRGQVVGVQDALGNWTTYGYDLRHEALARIVLQAAA